MDYIKFCQNYFALTNVPVSLIQGETPLYSAIGEALSLELGKPDKVFWETDDVTTNPTFCRYSPEIEYSCIHVEGTDYYIALGPVFSVPISDEIVNSYMRENHIPMLYREDVSGFLHAIPLTTQQQFYRHAINLHMGLNKADVELDDLFLKEDPNKYLRREKQMEQILEGLEEGLPHNTYAYEQQLYRLIQNGDLLLLDEFLQKAPDQLPEGKLAFTPLRHAKNLFIQNVTKAGMLAGIPAGLSADTVYQLTQLYIQECEKLQTIGSIQSLQYAMLKDFCQRCAEEKLPAGISAETYRCLAYIHAHICESISVADLARFVGRSSSYLTRRFKDELGMSIGACIMNQKLAEAKKLLTYSEKSLAEISCFLGFSSQSYFQNVFKKTFAITPTQYRKETQKR